MPIGTSGILVLVSVFLFALLLFLLGAYCHFCAETDSGGHFYHSREHIAVVFVPKGGSGDGGPGKNKSDCKCSKKFKGSCKHCQGDDFVDDGTDGKHPDFSDFGGDKGLDAGSPGWGSNQNQDPIRSFLGGNSDRDGDNSGGGFGDSMMIRDD